MELREALLQLNVIHAHVSRTELFRGYRAISVGTTAVFALLGGFLQAAYITNPVENVRAYLQLWIGIAGLSVVTVAIEQVRRCLNDSSKFAFRQTLLVVGQFLPCLVAGAVLTWMLTTHAPQCAPLLPGLWAILFSLGVFASCPYLPREISIVAIYYLVAGSGAIAWSHEGNALAPGAMVYTFGIGQLLTAAVLYHTLERPRGER